MKVYYDLFSLVGWLVEVEIDVILRLKDMKCTVLYVDNKISGNYIDSHKSYEILEYHIVV